MNNADVKDLLYENGNFCAFKSVYENQFKSLYYTIIKLGHTIIKGNAEILGNKIHKNQYILNYTYLLEMKCMKNIFPQLSKERKATS